MSLFQLHTENNLIIILLTSCVWLINYRSTFKNNSDSMGLGSCWVLRFDPMIILIKNIICIFYLGIFIYEIRLSKSDNSIKHAFVQKKEGAQIRIELQTINNDEEDILNSVYKVNNLDNIYMKILFWLKIFLLILFLYIIEELYFMLSNAHVLDRTIVHIRNVGIVLALFIFPPLILKKYICHIRHQLVTFIIIFLLSALHILYDALFIDRFLKKFNPINSSIYYTIYFLMGLEFVIIKYLVENHFISIFLILGIKGLIGTIIFIPINALYSYKQFYDFIDSILEFEYDDMIDEFNVIYKIIYILSLVILQYLKIYIINKYSENHLQMILMLVDLIYFPIYCLERFAIEKFTIFRVDSFVLGIIVVTFSIFLMLIFNEMLECKFWGLNLNLQININKRLINDKENFNIDRETRNDSSLNNDSDSDDF